MHALNSINSINELLTNLKSNKEIMKTIYFLFSTQTDFYNVQKKERLLKESGYQDKILPALAEIKKIMKHYGIARYEITQYLNEVDLYLAYLLEETKVETAIVILSFLQKEMDIVKVFTTPLESLPEFADDKYGIVSLNEKSFANHQGIFHEEKFYYYSPVFLSRRNTKEPPVLIDLLFEHLKKNNLVSYRLDTNLCVEKNNYKPIYNELSEVYQGREINLDDIKFPLYSGGIEYFCVYNPISMKKIQFKISNRKDGERWIEVEELWDIHSKGEQEYFITRYLHSIFQPSSNLFVHVDGSINIYKNKSYKSRIERQIAANADLHIKQWLVEGELEILDWAKLTFHFFNDPDLLMDAFRGDLIEEVFRNN